MTGGYRYAIPEELITHVRSGCGAVGDAWLAGLPGVILQLEKTWSVRVSEPFAGIEYNFVAKAETSDGKPVVVKIAPPWNPVEIFGEAAYLAARNGIGCVRLLAEEISQRAILIERIFPGEALWQCFTGREMDSIRPAINTLKQVLMPVPAHSEHIVELDDWYDGLRRYSDTDFPREYAAKALEIYDRLSAQPGRRYYLHGDYHPGNIVTDERWGYTVIDPKGVAGHIGFEIAAFLNNFHWWQEKRSDIRERLGEAVDLFAGSFEIDDYELREWCFSQQVIGAWWNFKDMPDLYDGGVVKADIWDV